MDPTTMYILIGVLIVLAVLTIWYFMYYKPHHLVTPTCKTDADCKSGEMCSSGVCQHKS
jgi:hypothetical protein